MVSECSCEYSNTVNTSNLKMEESWNSEASATLPTAKAEVTISVNNELYSPQDRVHKHPQRQSSGHVRNMLGSNIVRHTMSPDRYFVLSFHKANSWIVLPFGHENFLRNFSSASFITRLTMPAAFEVSLNNQLNKLRPKTNFRTVWSASFWVRLENPNLKTRDGQLCFLARGGRWWAYGGMVDW
jgi:hypothetical protein